MRRDRRRFHLARAPFRTLLLSALTLAAPVAKRPPKAPVARSAPAAPTVAAAIDTFESPPPPNPAHAYDALIDEAADIYGLEPALIRAVIRAESRFNPLAVSRAGAMGLMQLMPQVIDELGVSNPFDPRENIMAGARLLRRLLDRHRGNVEVALASYNAGPRAVARHGNRVPPFRETRRYVKLITRWLAQEHAQRA